MSAMTMEAELKRIRELYDPRRDSTDIFARHYRVDTHDDNYENIIVDSSGAYEYTSNALPPYPIGIPLEAKALYTKPENKEPGYGHAIQYSEEERMLHFTVPTVGSSAPARPRP
ncbi:hypothetical protein TWF506_004292 [Arthrobotrys conoides]|uniref:Uncharacterized protein n=1 Tax=Arthrobotrys conoides TaxID=74498 RepID=A0AAN8N0G0_9PEZI